MKNEIIVQEAIPDSEMIIIKQLPVIEQQLASVKARFEEAAASARAMECNEDTIKEVKARRAEFTKVFAALEAKRKEVKSAILAPYEAFEKVYKECVSDIYKACDKELAEKIHAVEDGLKALKASEAQAYFDEYCLSKSIDFLKFSDVPVSINLTISKKAIREGIKRFVDAVSDDLAMIDTQEYSAEILAEYKAAGYNVSQAITKVVGRHKAIAEEQQRIDALKARQAETEAAAEHVEEIAEAMAPPVEVQPEPEVEAGAPAASDTYEVSFKVRGTLEQIKALKKFLTEGGYDYE